MDSYVIDLKTIADSRGALTAIEGAQDIPFEIKRIFYMHHVSSDRGGHAHIDTDQVLIPIHGSLRVKLFNGKETEEYVMNDCTLQICMSLLPIQYVLFCQVPIMIWADLCVQWMHICRI